jgi:hypothetical protein
MKLTFNVKERLTIGNIFNPRGSIQDQLTIRDILSKCKIGKGEEEVIKLKLIGDHFQWDESKTIDKEIEFTDAEYNLMKTSVEKLDAEKAVNFQTLDVCLKIKG